MTLTSDRSSILQNLSSRLNIVNFVSELKNLTNTSGSDAAINSTSTLDTIMKYVTQFADQKNTIKALRERLGADNATMAQLSKEVTASLANTEATYKKSVVKYEIEEKEAQRLEDVLNQTQTAEFLTEKKFQLALNEANHAHAVVLDAAEEGYNQTVSSLYLLRKGIGLQEPFVTVDSWSRSGTSRRTLACHLQILLSVCLVVFIAK